MATPIQEGLKHASIDYSRLETTRVRFLDPEDAEQMAIKLIAQKAHIKGEPGKEILSWSEFNENPDPLVNELLARILISQIDESTLRKHSINGFNVLPKGNMIGVLSIESSASYLASEVTHEVYRKLNLDRPPRILRARKSTDGSPPSPAMGDKFLKVTVYPITAGDEPRYLAASFPSQEDLQHIRTLLVVDDFRARGSTLDGGTRLGLDLMRAIGVPEAELTIVPMAGLGKPDQEQPAAPIITTATIHKTITALNVHFGIDSKSHLPIIQANGFEPLVLQNATAADLTKP